MESEYAVANSQLKSQYKKKVEIGFRELDEVIKRFNRLEADYIDSTNKGNLMKEATKGENKQPGNNINVQLSSQNYKFGQAYRTVTETKKIVNDSNVALLEQREVMEGIKIKNEEIYNDVRRIDCRVTSMRNKDLINKAILWAVIFLLVVTNIVVFVMKIKKLFF